MDRDNQRRFRNALGRFATGVTVVTARGADGADVGVTANSFNSVSLRPPMVLWSIARDSSSLATFEQTDFFSVHVLASEQRALSERFAKRGGDRFAGLALGRGHGGVPLIEGAAAVFQCRTAHRYPGGDHLIVVGEVLEFDEAAHAPLIYHAGQYGLIASDRLAPQDAEAAGLAVALRRALGAIDAKGALEALLPTERSHLSELLGRIG